MKVIDSNGWLEAFTDGRNAHVFKPMLLEGDLIVPAITIYEVVKRLLVLGFPAEAARAETHMRRFPVVELNAERASKAAHLAVQHKLPLADSIIFAAAVEFKATLWTQDEDFANIEGVRYVPYSE
jgi:toxin FitB